MWLLEPEIFKGELGPFIETLEQYGIEYHTCQFGQRYADIIRKFPQDAKVIVLGSFQLAKIIENSTRWKPGVLCNSSQLSCEYYYPRFGPHLLNENYLFLPLGDLPRRKKSLLNQGPVFLRPTSCRKTFDALLLNEENWDAETKILRLKEPETLVVVAPAQKITREWRTIIAGKKVVTGSLYKENNAPRRERGVPENVQKYAEQVLAEISYQPDPLFTLDICETEGRLAVLEVGPFSCSGFYASDPHLILKALGEIP